MKYALLRLSMFAFDVLFSQPRHLTYAPQSSEEEWIIDFPPFHHYESLALLRSSGFA